MYCYIPVGNLWIMEGQLFENDLENHFVNGFMLVFINLCIIVFFHYL